MAEFLVIGWICPGWIKVVFGSISNWTRNLWLFCVVVRHSHGILSPDLNEHEWLTSAWHANFFLLLISDRRMNCISIWLYFVGFSSSVAMNVMHWRPGVLVALVIRFVPWLYIEKQPSGISVIELYIKFRFNIVHTHHPICTCDGMRVIIIFFLCFFFLLFF